MSRNFYIFTSLAVLFLGLSFFAPPSWYEWMWTETKLEHPNQVFPVACATFTLCAVSELAPINNYLKRKGLG